MARALLLRSSSAADRVERAIRWLSSLRRDDEVLIIGASSEAAAELARDATRTLGASFGFHRASLGRTAATIAAPLLAARGLSPVGALALEAVTTRVVHALGKRGALGRFQPVAKFPGLPRALARTLAEVRSFGVTSADLARVSPDFARIHDAYEAELARAKLSDRALVLRLAIDAVAKGEGGPASLTGRPLLLLDVPIHAALHRDLVAALAARSPAVLATAPDGDEQSLASLRVALGDEAEEERGELPFGGATSLERLQAFLFHEDDALERGSLGEDVTVLSAPGESRECIEIARRAMEEARAGVPFDRMAILLRAPQQYRAHVEEALRRASIPAYFARGSVEPDPAGRAFAALLACAGEGLSARRFAEYLSLGQVPDATLEGAPPAAIPAADRWMPPDEELVGDRVREMTTARPIEPDALERPAQASSRPTSSTSAPSDAASAHGTLRAPRRWEKLLVESAVIGGLDRWEARLDALTEKLSLDLGAAFDASDIAAARIQKSLDDLGALRRFAMPLLVELAHLPASARWGEWIDALTALASRSLRRPDRVLAVLAELYPMADVGPVSLAEVRLVLHRRLTELVVLPTERTAGKIFVAPVEAARGLCFETVFVPGLAEKLFPQKVGEEPILLDRARAILDLPTNRDRIANERLALRLAVGAAQRRLVLSYPRVDLDQSRPRVPSFYGLEVLRAAEGALPGFDELARRAEEASGARIGWPAPDVPERAIDEAEYDLARLERLFGMSAAETAGAARYLLSQNPHLARALRSRARRWTIKRWLPADGLVDPSGDARAALDRHAFSARSFSPTALQTFASCPYKFLLYAIHKLSPRRVPEAIEEMDPLERGSLVHEALHELSDALHREGLLPVTLDDLDACRAILDEVLDRVAARFREKLAPAIDRVWDDGIASVRADLREWLRRAALDDRWTPFRFELSFGLAERRARDPASTDKPVSIALGQATTLHLRGSIDAVERSAAGTLRATDYKTGRVRASSDVTMIGGGEVLQPVLYALALEQLFPGEIVEGGRLYYCTSAGGFEEVIIPLDDEARTSAAAVLDVIGRSLTEGFFPAAPKAGACDRCDYRPVCGPYEEIRAAKKSPERLAPLRRLRALR